MDTGWFFLPVYPTAAAAEGDHRVLREQLFFETKRCQWYSIKNTPHDDKLGFEIWCRIRSKQSELPVQRFMFVVPMSSFIHKGALKRRYFPIWDYIDPSFPEVHKDIFLVTDDDHTITEAKLEFPQSIQLDVCEPPSLPSRV